MAKSLPRKVKVGFRVAMASQPFEKIFTRLCQSYSRNFATLHFGLNQDCLHFLILVEGGEAKKDHEKYEKGKLESCLDHRHNFNFHFYFNNCHWAFQKECAILKASMGLDVKYSWMLTRPNIKCFNIKN